MRRTGGQWERLRRLVNRKKGAQGNCQWVIVSLAAGFRRRWRHSVKTGALLSSAARRRALAAGTRGHAPSPISAWLTRHASVVAAPAGASHGPLPYHRNRFRYRLLPVPPVSPIHEMQTVQWHGQALRYHLRLRAPPVPSLRRYRPEGPARRQALPRRLTAAAVSGPRTAPGARRSRARRSRAARRAAAGLSPRLGGHGCPGSSSACQAVAQRRPSSTDLAASQQPSAAHTPGRPRPWNRSVSQASGANARMTSSITRRIVV